MSQPCEQTGRVSVLEANQAHIMRELGELKEDTKEIKKDIRDFIASANEKFAPRKEVEKLKDDVDKQKWAWAWATGFAAAIVFVMEKAVKLF